MAQLQWRKIGVGYTAFKDGAPVGATIRKSDGVYHPKGWRIIIVAGGIRNTTDGVQTLALAKAWTERILEVFTPL